MMFARGRAFFTTPIHSQSFQSVATSDLDAMPIPAVKDLTSNYSSLRQCAKILTSNPPKTKSEL
eukprot:6459346-Amphidinium_carterae.2